MLACYCYLLCVLLPMLASSCSTYNFSCGNYSTEIQYPFSVYRSSCRGLHIIYCMNLVPMIKFHGQGFFYPVWNISYPDSSLVVHDLRISSFFHGSNCVFLYDLHSPIPRFNVTDLSVRVSSDQVFFNCKPIGHGHLNNFFSEFFNLSSCKNYSLYYSNTLEGQSPEIGVLPTYCSRTNGTWFDWELSFDKVDGNLSLLSAGFSRKWTPFPDCFSCQIIGANCSDQCRGVTPSSGKSQNKVIIGVVCGIVGFILACALAFFFYKRKLNRRSPSSSSTHAAHDIPPKSFSKNKLEPLSFDGQTYYFCYEELEEATTGFDESNELGEGGYGTVYKGVLRDGRVVAVKRLYETNYKRVEQFMNEVEILSSLRHPNLVALYGCTSPTSSQLLLVYEYVANGTIADHLHDPDQSRSLPLSLRLSMAINTASALSYLHSADIIHRDIKTHNILLDEHFNVKVADFGLSRLFPPNATHVTTAPQGTPGYLDPEYHRFYQLTEKSDVYSFGVVLMELICSRPAVDVERKPNEISLAMVAVNKIQSGELGQLVDPVLGFYSDKEANRVVTQIAELAFRCLQMDREVRPSMKEVLEELRDIETGRPRNEDEGEDKGIEESSLLKSSTPFSPDSVVNTWMSRSTTPNTSDQIV